MGLSVYSGGAISRIRGSAIDRKHLPTQFSNEIFYTRASHLDPHSYTSGLSLKFVLEGLEEFTVNRKLNQVKPGQLFIVNQGSEVTCSIREVSTAFSIFIEDDLLQEVLNADQILASSLQNDLHCEFYPELTHTSSYRPLRRFLVNLKQQLDAGLVDQRDTASVHYRIVELMLLGHLRNRDFLNRVGAIKITTKRELVRRLSLVKDYLSDNFTGKFDLDEISKIACLSKYHLIRSFKAVYGSTPNQYVIHLRLQLAKSLLKEDALSAREIAAKVGFYDANAFTKKFKATVGLTPSDFRRM